MSILTNRRHITAERELEPAGHDLDDDLGPGGRDMTSLISALDAQTEAMAQLLRAERSDIAQLCITDREPAQSVMRDFPVPRSRRYIVRRTGQGGTYALLNATPTLIVTANEARLGGVIVVSGGAAVTLLLTVDLLEPGSAVPLSAATPQLWLAASGGAWDFRLGDALWCGNVIAYASGASTVTVAEV